MAQRLFHAGLLRNTTFLPPRLAPSPRLWRLHVAGHQQRSFLVCASCSKPKQRRGCETQQACLAGFEHLERRNEGPFLKLGHVCNLSELICAEVDGTPLVGRLPLDGTIWPRLLCACNWPFGVNCHMGPPSQDLLSIKRPCSFCWRKALQCGRSTAKTAVLSS